MGYFVVVDIKSEKYFGFLLFLLVSVLWYGGS